MFTGSQLQTGNKDIGSSVDENRRSLRAKWGTTVIEEGWTPVPVRLLNGQHKLGIKPSEMTVLLHLLKHWFNADDEYVFPRQARIAGASGMSVRTVQRSIDSLEHKGLISKEKKQSEGSIYQHNHYSLAPLVKKVQALDLTEA
ncbi:helix-turn-helix domain-containing protein [Halomonas sp. SCS19]|uniref:helix-turn-helix domain-containing protein n=1 Tax=Halomonas sp. SCS19 TaxID=2950870 RepID=UPI0032DEDA2E